MTDEQLNEIQQRLEAISKDEVFGDTANFIVNSAADVRALLAEVKELQKLNTELGEDVAHQMEVNRSLRGGEQVREQQAEIKRLRYLEGRTFPIMEWRPVPWCEAEKAYAVYAKHHGKEQTIERMAERGGFSKGEFSCLWLGHDPWACGQEHEFPDFECLRLKAEIERLRAGLNKAGACAVGEEGGDATCQNVDPQSGTD